MDDFAQHDVEREIQRAAALDEIGQRVPVDPVGKRVREDIRQAEALELLDAPRAHEAPPILVIEVFGGSTSGSISVSLPELRVSVVPLLRIGSRANAVIAGNCDVHTSVARLFGFR